MKRTMIAFAGLALCTFANVSQAARVEADPNKLYVVAPEQGAWMICVTSYTGEKALELARELALEIRQRDNLPAWVYNRGEEERRKQREEREKLRQMYPQAEITRFRTTRIENQCAVMVGGFKDIEAARRELEKVKKLKPPRSTKLMQLVTFTHPIPTSEKGKYSETKEGTFLNPFPASFVARNPTVPHQPREHKPDSFLKELNVDEPYSLLKCRQPWTLVVTTFEGSSTIKDKSGASGGFLDKLRAGFSGSGDLLTANALQAREVAKVLQKQGFEAYVLHTRAHSIVTVGGFERADDVKLLQVQRVLGGMQLGTIKLFSIPRPMEVPRL